MHTYDLCQRVVGLLRASRCCIIHKSGWNSERTLNPYRKVVINSKTTISKIFQYFLPCVIHLFVAIGSLRYCDVTTISSNSRLFKSLGIQWITLIKFQIYYWSLLLALLLLALGQQRWWNLLLNFCNGYSFWPSVNARFIWADKCILTMCVGVLWAY